MIACIASGAASVTALIPAFVGARLLIAVLIGSRSELAHKDSMHVALAIALLGALGSLMNVVKIGDLIAGDAERPGAVITSTIMFVQLVGYLAAGVRSFVKARAVR